MAFEQVGVEAVLAGIRQFQSDADRFNSSVGGMARTVKNVATAPVRALSGFLSSLGDSLRRVGEIALGIIVANTFGRIAGAIRDAARAAIDAAIEFQTLTIRFEGLLAREFVKTGAAEDFTEGLNMAKGAAVELLDWIKQIAVTTPFTVESLSRTVSMAQAFGFATDFSKDLTLAIGNFTAGMGLSEEVMERIIQNFGQMRAQGKVTGTELRDLARGALVPVTDVLHRMQENMGLTEMSFEDFRDKVASGALDVNEFFTAFIDLANEEFPGAMERMSRTFTGVTSNIKDFIQVILGAEILGPTLDILTAQAADFLDTLMSDEVLQTARRLGEAIGDVAGALFGDLLPAFTGLLQIDFDVLDFFGRITEFLTGPNSIARFLKLFAAQIEETGDPFEAFRRSIFRLPTELQGPAREAVRVVEEALAGFREGGVFGFMEAIGIDPDVVATIEGVVDDVVAAFENLRTFWREFGPEIMDAVQQVFDALFQTGEDGEAGFLETLTDTLIEQGPEIVDTIQSIADTITEDILPAIRDFVDFLKTDEGQRLIELAITFLLVKSALESLAPVILTVAGFVALLVGGFGLLMLAIGILVGVIVGSVLAFTIWRDDIEDILNSMGLAIETWVVNTFNAIDQWETDVFMAISDWVVKVTEKFSQWALDTTAKFIGWGLENLGTFLTWKDDIIRTIAEWATDTLAKFTGWIADVKSKITGVNWGALGSGIVDGIRNGLASKIGSLARKAAEMARAALAAAKAALGMDSPSKEFEAVGANAAESMANALINKFTNFMGLASPSSVFRGFGEGLMEGLAQGIIGGMRAPAIAAEIAAVNVAAPMAHAAAAPTSVTNQTTNNYSLNIRSSASQEPIIADFEMLKSIANT